MNTTRRQFIAKTVAALATAPLLARAATKTPAPISPDWKWKIPPIEEILGPAAIKVPSNRCSVYTDRQLDGSFATRVFDYDGEWDGSFKWEVGCTNPAYILADLYGRTGVEPDWVVATKEPVVCSPAGPMVLSGLSQLLKPRFNWQMLYDWGKWADEVVHKPTGIEPRYTLAGCTVHPEHLRDHLRMMCLQWQSTDPRYRTSWPGVPYEGGV